MSDTDSNQDQLRLIRLPDVLKRTGLSRPSVYRSMSAGKFPKPTRFGRSTFWASHEVDGWIRDRLSDRMEATAA